MHTSGFSVAQLLAGLLEGRPEPLPYAPGTHQLWTDEHVSRGMLAAHLDPGTDAASRRPETIDATVAWLAGRLPAGARLLDLGCGPGLYSRRLAEAGFDVVGIDYSARSIEYARAHGDSVRYICGDYRDVVLDETFDVVLLVYLDLGTFSPQDAHHILDRVRGWLSPGGMFLFDLATPAHRAGSEHRRDWGVAEEGFWSAEPHVWLSRTVRYPDESLYLDEHVVVTATDTRVYRVWERCFTPESIRAELHSAGMTVQTLYGDLAGTPHTESSGMLGVSAATNAAGHRVPPARTIAERPARHTPLAHRPGNSDR
jgi:SAM-dependent methyltransferase